MVQFERQIIIQKLVEHSGFAKKKESQILNSGNYNQFEGDDAKSKLQFLASWKWRSGGCKLVNDQAYFEQKICCKS